MGLRVPLPTNDRITRHGVILPHCASRRAGGANRRQGGAVYALAPLRRLLAVGARGAVIFS